MTYNEACEYVSLAYEAEGEQFAEWGSGAVSLGYNPAEWAPDYQGYRTSDDPEFARAQRIIDEANATISTIQVRALARGYEPADDEIPF